jgi:hypothetical protein
MQRGGGVVVFVHIDEPATPGCKCLATLLKGRLPVHVCRFLCCCSVTLVYGDLFCLQGFKIYYSNVEYPSHRPHAKFNFFVWSVTFF